MAKVVERFNVFLISLRTDTNHIDFDCKSVKGTEYLL